MTENTEGWQRVGEALEAALARRTLPFRKVAERIDISPNKLRELRQGKPGNYRADTLARVSKELLGAPDAIDRLLAGEDPAGFDPPPTEQAPALGMAGLDGTLLSQLPPDALADLLEAAAAKLRGDRT